jgi:hypothetical protein
MAKWTNTGLLLMGLILSGCNESYQIKEAGVSTATDTPYSYVFNFSQIEDSEYVSDSSDWETL